MGLAATRYNHRKYDTVKPLSNHRLNRGLRYWQDYFPGLTSPKSTDLTRRFRYTWFGDDTDWHAGTGGQSAEGDRGWVHYVSSDRLRVDNHPLLQGFSEMTIAVTVFEQDWASDGIRPLVTKASKSGTNIEYSLILNRSGGTVNIEFQLSPDGTSGSAVTLSYAWTGIVFRKPYWLVVTWDGSTGRMYLAGRGEPFVEVANGPMSIGSTFVGTADLVTGSWHNNTDFQTGPMGTVQIADRAWTPTECKMWAYEAKRGFPSLLRRRQTGMLPSRTGSRP